MRSVAAVAFFALAQVHVVGCGRDPATPGFEYAPDMARSVPYDSFAPNPNTPDRKTLLSPPPGTIARGSPPLRYGPGPAEAERAGRELTNPVASTKEVVARGQAVFETRCFECHGKGGEGDGPIVPPFPSPPSLLAARAKELPDGRMFHIITFGQGLMPPHAFNVPADDRWKVIHYIRRLQENDKS